MSIIPALDNDAYLRSRDRLMLALNQTQRNELNTLGYFHVVAPSGNNYLISSSDPVCNIFLEHPRVRYCLHLGDYWHSWDQWPTPDHMLAQALMILTDEQTFRIVAHRMGPW